MAAVTSIMRAHQIMISKVEDALKPHGLTFSRYEVLMLLSFTKRGEMPMSKASARLQVHPTSITNAVDRLERAGLVHRVAHPDDRRTTLIRITEDGREKATVATKQLNSEVFGNIGLPTQKARQLVEILTEYRYLAGDFTEPPSER
ncbi:MarR family transcriptional regulator [Hoyosella rhizosphaerae]|nr:MarR family transcriptional regulator [Hoyosella rhizosphaerae]